MQTKQLSGSVYKAYSLRDSKPVQMINLSYGEKDVPETDTKVLRRLSNATQLYDMIFCAHYNIVSREDGISILREPGLPLPKPRQHEFKLKLDQLRDLIPKILRAQNCEVVYRIQPVLVKRGQYLVRVALTQITQQDHFLFTYETEHVMVDLAPLGQPITFTPQQIEVYDRWIDQKIDPTREIIDLQEKFYKDVFKQMDNHLDSNKQPKHTFRIMAVSLSNSTQQILPPSIVSQMRECPYNPTRKDILYYQKYNRFVLHQGSRKYHNFYHFRDNVIRISKRLPTMRISQDEDETNNVQTISLLSSLKPLFQLEVLQYPCRGRTCRHAQFYELRALYDTVGTNAQGEDVFVCPVCSKPLKEQNIFLIDYLTPVLDMVEYHCKSNGYSIYDSHLVVNHRLQLVEYCYASSYLRPFSVVVPTLYDKLMDPKRFFDQYTLRIIREENGFFGDRL